MNKISAYVVMAANSGITIENHNVLCSRDAKVPANEGCE
jgi:hypothetical protein